MENEKSHEWDDHAWFGLDATSRYGPAPAERSPPASHYAVQWLARAARAYVPPQPDDEHTNLGWDGALSGFTTHPLKDGAWLSLKITDLTLALHVGEKSTQVQSFSLEGCPDAQVGQWLSERLGARGL